MHFALTVCAHKCLSRRTSARLQFASNVTWHRFGPLAGFTYGPRSSGLSFSQSLNARGLPSERRDLWFGNARLHDTLSWDGNGNLTAITDNVGSVESFRNASRSMVYDGLDRLTIANSAPQPALRGSTPWTYSWGEARFGYDGLDNVRSFVMGAADFTYAYDANGRLQSVSQAWMPTPVVSYTHNARGQMTGRQFGGQQFTLNWDSAHRVTQTWNAASSVVESYRYDAHGHRVRTVRGGETVYQVYTQAGDLLSETSSNGATRKYARLGGRLIGESVNGGRYAIHTDVIGSVRQKTDVLGTLVYEDVRAPYGSTLLGGEYQNGPAFTGHMEDGATGLTYMKARYYDPVAMRFISPDPVYVDLVTGGNFNRYWYANNNPYTFIDPDGRQAVTGTRIDRSRVIERILRAVPFAPVPPPPPSSVPDNDPATTYPSDSPSPSGTESVRPQRPEGRAERPTREDYTGRPERPGTCQSVPPDEGDSGPRTPDYVTPDMDSDRFRRGPGSTQIDNEDNSVS